MKIKWKVKKYKDLDEYFSENEDLYLVFDSLKQSIEFNTKNKTRFNSSIKKGRDEITEKFLQDIHRDHKFKKGELCVRYIKTDGELLWVEFDKKNYFANQEKITNFKTPENFL